MFNWKFLNVWMSNDVVERHYKCQNTGAYRCKEYKLGKSYKTVTYCLPDSENYNIKTEQELLDIINELK
jgi:hypothetical protein